MFVRPTVLGSVKDELDSARHERARLGRQELARQERMGMMWLKDPDCVAKLDLVVKDSDVAKVQTDLEFAAKWLVLFLVVLAAIACTVLAFFRAARSGARRSGTGRCGARRDLRFSRNNKSKAPARLYYEMTKRLPCNRFTRGLSPLNVPNYLATHEDKNLI